jgi:uncharacterized protein (TIGR03118 family)
MNKSVRRLSVTTAIAVGILYAGAWRADADFIQTNLVSDIQGLATITDPLLINPWGISHSATSPFWTSNNGTSTATLYAVTANNNVTQVTAVNAQGFVNIPTTASPPPPAPPIPQGPTGQVNNSNTASFQLTPGDATTSARFIFANLNGTISAWAGGLAATVKVTTPGAVYTGLAINQAQTQLYAARAGGIDVFNSSFQPVNNGAFATPAPVSARNLVPFNVQTLKNGDVAVTYAPAGGRPAEIVATPGQGAVAIFDGTGTTVKQTILGNPGNTPLASPWGITVAPASFGEFANDLLVGNFSFVASEINAFDPTTGKFEGTIPINIGSNMPGGLWALGFGTGGSNGSPDTLFFTDGINGEMNGLFAALNVSVPGPIVGAGLPGLVAACGGLLALARRRRRRTV